MNKIHSVITAIGAYVPQYILTNEEVSTMVDTSDEWIMKRIGIKERRILKPEEGKGVSYLALKAIEDMRKRKDFDPLEIDAVVFATTTPDFIFPQAANLIIRHMGMKNAFGFDLNGACSGFLYALEVGNGLIASERHKKVLVIGGDVLSSVTNYEDRNTCPIFGDGCGCVILEPTTEEVGIMDSILRSEGDIENYLGIDGGGSVNPASYETVDKKMHYIHQDGKVVFKKAVSAMANTSRSLMQKNNLTNNDIAWVVPHQANLRIIDAVASMLDIPIEKVMINIHKFGNSSAGTIPTCLAEWEPRLHKGDNIILTAFGGGFTWGAIYIKWGYDSNETSK